MWLTYFPLSLCPLRYARCPLEHCLDARCKGLQIEFCLCVGLREKGLSSCLAFASRIFSLRQHSVHFFQPKLALVFFQAGSDSFCTRTFANFNYNCSIHQTKRQARKLNLYFLSRTKIMLKRASSITKRQGKVSQSLLVWLCVAMPN